MDVPAIEADQIDMGQSITFTGHIRLINQTDYIRLVISE